MQGRPFMTGRVRLVDDTRTVADVPAVRITVT
jgi:hypothetical protein